PSLALSIPYIQKKNGGKASFSAKQAISKSVQEQRVILQCMSEIIKSLSEVEEEFGYDHLMGGGMIIPWDVSQFLAVN
ncbi:hypothetical protein S83_004504, partial [Arachis hypogaea]